MKTHVPAPTGSRETSAPPARHDPFQCKSARAVGRAPAPSERRALDQEPVTTVPAIVHDVLRSPGQPLDAATRSYMEPRFGHDFGQVRVHTDARAAESARAVNAHAYTVGHDVVFGENEFEPTAHRGRELLAHELAHSAQQQKGSGPSPGAASHAAFETNAQLAASDVVHGRPLSTALMSSGVGLVRAAVPIDAYTDDMLAKALAEVRERLKKQSYPGRDRDVDLHMALKREADKRELAAARAEAATVLARMDETRKQTEAEEKAEEAERNAPMDLRPKSLLLEGDKVYAAPQFDYEKIERAFKEQKETDQKAAIAAQEIANEGRPARLAAARRQLTLHGLRRGDETEVMMRFLTTQDMLVLRKNGLEEPGILSNFGGRYARNAIAVIDKLVPRDPMQDRADLADLQRGAAAIEHTSQKIEGLANEGPHALAGRVIGATTAYVVGKDPLWGGEVGAAFGGLAGAKYEAQAWASLEVSSRGPSNDPAYASSANVESAPARDPMPAPRPPKPPVPEKPPAPSGSAQSVSMKLPAEAASNTRPMRRPPGRGARGTYSATEKTGTQHQESTPAVEVLPRGTVPMKDFEPPQPGHYIKRKPPSAETQRQILARAGRTTDGRLRDANTGRALNDGEAVWGHSPNYQFKEMRDMAEKLGWTQEEFDRFFEDPAKWQIEYGPSNSGRTFDRIPRQRPVH